MALLNSGGIDPPASFFYIFYFVLMTTTITNCDNNKEEQAPNAIPFTHHIFDFDLHPSQPILAAGLINGQVHWYKKLSIIHS